MTGWSPPAVDWGALAPYLIAFWTPAIALLTAYLAHLWDERSKRTEFRRAKRYDRKFTAYQQVLATLSQLGDLLDFQQFVTAGELQRELEDLAGGIPPTMPEPDRTARVASLQSTYLDAVVRLMSGALDFPAGITSLSPPQTQPFNPGDFLSDRAYRLTSHALVRSFHEYEKAMNTVKVLGHSKQLGDAIESLWETLMQVLDRVRSRTAIPASDWTLFETELSEKTERLTAAIREDLEATIEGRPPHQVEFVREEEA